MQITITFFAWTGKAAFIGDTTNLQDANLYGADLRGADLRGANLYGANLQGVENAARAPWGGLGDSGV